MSTKNGCASKSTDGGCHGEGRSGHRRRGTRIRTWHCNRQLVKRMVDNIDEESIDFTFVGGSSQKPRSRREVWHSARGHTEEARATRDEILLDECVVGTVDGMHETVRGRTPPSVLESARRRPWRVASKSGASSVACCTKTSAKNVRCVGSSQSQHSKKVYGRVNMCVWFAPMLTCVYFAFMFMCVVSACMNLCSHQFTHVRACVQKLRTPWKQETNRIVDVNQIRRKNRTAENSRCVLLLCQPLPVERSEVWRFLSQSLQAVRA